MGSPVAFLNDQVVKTILMIVGGLILKKWPAFVNKAIPTAMAALSGILSALALAFPAASGVQNSSFVFSSFAGIPMFAYASFGASLASWAANTFVPVAFAIAAHSGSKNTREWAQIGLKIFN